MTRHEGWLAGRLVRLAALQTKVSDRISVRRHRFTGRASRRTDQMAGRSLLPWYRFTEGIALRSERFTHPLRVGWHAVADGWVRLAHPVRILSGRTADRITTGWDRVAGRVLVPWYRFSDRVAGGRERLTAGVKLHWHRSVDRIEDLAPGTKALVAGLPLVIVASVFVLIRADGADVGDTSLGNDRQSQAAGPQEARASRETTGSMDQLPGVNVHVNDTAGYLFSYPDGWGLSTSGTTTALFDPDGGVNISFGIAPPGTLDQASDRLVERLTKGYTGVRLVTDRIQRTVQGHPSLVVGGRGTDAAGIPVRFVVVTIGGPDENRAISINFEAGSEPLDALPAIQEIVASFRVSRAA